METRHKKGHKNGEHHDFQRCRKIIESLFDFKITICVFYNKEGRPA